MAENFSPSKPEAADQTFVFVVGLHHSGTSLLHRLLGKHPEISRFSGTGVPRDEGQHLQSVVSTAAALGEMGRFGFHPRAHMDEHDPLTTAENAEKIYGEWAPHWDLGKAFLMEKSPATLLRMRFFQKLFPNSVFVVILRHPIALAVGTRRGFVRYAVRHRAYINRHGKEVTNPFTLAFDWREWCKFGLRMNLEHSLVCYERAIDDLAHIRRAFVLRYEDFVADPDDALGRLFAFLGLAPVPVAEPVHPDVNAAYLASWQRGPLAPLRKRLGRRYEKRARAIGYSLIEPQTHPPLRLDGQGHGVTVLSRDRKGA